MELNFMLRLIIALQIQYLCILFNEESKDVKKR